MKLAAICFSARGAGLLRKLKESSCGFEICAYYRTEEIQEGLERIEGRTEDLVRQCFEEDLPILFVSACGIAVRLIAPFVKDKLKDIPVLVTDDRGSYVIPLLSGHAGGANRLAQLLAEALGAVPVITTATDVNAAFSVDSFALEQRLTIEDREGIKKVSAKALSGQPIRIFVQDTLSEEVPDVQIADERLVEGALWLSPKRYVLGLGCKKGKTLAEIEAAAEQVIREQGLTFSDIYAFASVDVKAGEQAFLDLSQKYRLPFVVYSAARLASAKGEFTASAFVKESVGVDNVCERAAYLLSGGGELVCRKRIFDGVTVALAKRRGL